MQKKFSPRLIGMVVLLMSSLLAGCQSEFDGLGVQIPLKQHELKNGLKVFLVEDHSIPVVSYQTWFQVGSVNEEFRKTGLAHLFEHLMFKGTIKYGPKQFFFELESKGASVNAFTTRDHTVYHETFIPSLLEKVIDLESDRMKNLVITEELLKAEIPVVMEERKMRVESSPEGKIQEAIWLLAFEKHPYRNPVIGYMEDLIQMKASDLQTFFQTYYSPKNAAIVIVGDFDSGKTMELLKSYYEPISNAPADVLAKSRVLTKEPEQKGERRLTLYDDVSAPLLMQAYPIVSVRDDDSYVLDVLSNILFEGKSSRVYQKLVEEKKYLMGVSGMAFTPKYPGLFLVSAAAKKDAPLDLVETEIWKQFQEVQKNGVTPQELERAIKQLTLLLVNGIQTSHGLAHLIGSIYSAYGDPKDFAKNLSKYFKVTSEDVKRVAEKYFHPNRRSVITLLPNTQKPKGGV